MAKRVKVPKFKVFADRFGRLKVYHRKTGQAVDLAKFPFDTLAFWTECKRIEEAWQERLAGGPKPGTLGKLMEVFRKSDHWRDNLAPRTKADYLGCAKWLEPLADTIVPRLNTPFISKIVQRAADKSGWRRANYIRTFLSQVFILCVTEGLIDKDYAAAVPQRRRPKDAPRINRPWTAEELENVLAAAPPHLRVALALMANTGLDPSDAVRLTRARINGGVITGFRGKTETEFAIPIGPTLAAALDEAPRHDALTVLATSRGRPWSYSGLSTAWHRFKKELEQTGAIGPGLTMKGLRHTVGTILREAGVSPRDIADLLGQKTESMALHYSTNANLEAKNARTVARLEDARKNKG